MNPSLGYNDSPCTLSSLDVFDNYPRQEEIVQGLWEKISPKNSIEQPTYFPLQSRKHLKKKGAVTF